jgi:hypothetical protein
MISLGLLIRLTIAFGFGVIAGTVYYLVRLQEDHQQDLHNLDQRVLELEREIGRPYDGEEDPMFADLDLSPEYPIRFGKGA